MKNKKLILFSLFTIGILCLTNISIVNAVSDVTVEGLSNIGGNNYWIWNQVKKVKWPKTNDAQVSIYFCGTPLYAEGTEVCGYTEDGSEHEIKLVKPNVDGNYHYYNVSINPWFSNSEGYIKVVNSSGQTIAISKKIMIVSSLPTSSPTSTPPIISPTPITSTSVSSISYVELRDASGSFALETAWEKDRNWPLNNNLKTVKFVAKNVGSVYIGYCPLGPSNILSANNLSGCYTLNSKNSSLGRVSLNDQNLVRKLTYYDGSTAYYVDNVYLSKSELVNTYGVIKVKALTDSSGKNIESKNIQSDSIRLNIVGSISNVQIQGLVNGTWAQGETKTVNWKSSGVSKIKRYICGIINGTERCYYWTNANEVLANNPPMSFTIGKNIDQNVQNITPVPPNTYILTKNDLYNAFMWYAKIVDASNPSVFANSNGFKIVAAAKSKYHPADLNFNYKIEKNELDAYGKLLNEGKITLSQYLRVLQFYNMGGYHLDSTNKEDGFEAGLSSSMNSIKDQLASISEALSFLSQMISGMLGR